MLRVTKKQFSGATRYLLFDSDWKKKEPLARFTTFDSEKLLCTDVLLDLSWEKAVKNLKALAPELFCNGNSRFSISYQDNPDHIEIFNTASAPFPKTIERIKKMSIEERSTIRYLSIECEDGDVHISEEKNGIRLRTNLPANEEAKNTIHKVLSVFELPSPKVTKRLKKEHEAFVQRVA